MTDRFWGQTQSGPWVNAAFFCMSVLEEKNSVYSAIRIIDAVTFNDIGPAPPGPRQVPGLTLFLSLKPDRALGSWPLKMVIERPDGQRTDGPTIMVQFRGEERGHNVVLQVEAAFELEGLYWFDFELAGRLITRIPLRIVYAGASVPS